MYLIGASGHAKVIIEIMELLYIPLEGLYDDNPEITELMGYAVLGPPGKNVLSEKEFIISIGNNKTRERITKLFQLQYAKALIHPKATISNRVLIGEGTVVMGHAIINTGTRIGKHVIINTSASVDHDCIIQDFAHISPNATLSGGVTVGRGTHIGSGAVIIPNLKIGNYVTIGAGAVIIRDVEDHAVVVGNPGRVIRHGDKPRF